MSKYTILKTQAQKDAYKAYVERVLTPLVAPYETYTGKVLSERQCNILNDLSPVILQDLKVSLQTGYCDNVEAGLNNRHKIFVELANS